MHLHLISWRIKFRLESCRIHPLIAFYDHLLAMNLTGFLYMKPFCRESIEFEELCPRLEPRSNFERAFHLLLDTLFVSIETAITRASKIVQLNAALDKKKIFTRRLCRMISCQLIFLVNRSKRCRIRHLSWHFHTIYLRFL